MKLPLEWLSGKRVLTPDEVKKLEAGSEVYIHRCYGRAGEHLKVKATVIQSGRRKLLKYSDWRGLSITEPVKPAENIAYTLD